MREKRARHCHVDQGTPAPCLPNRVHVFVGEDMLLSTSPNDPVFYLNHRNVDRIWERWMQPSPQGHEHVYVPPQSAPASLSGHRINNELLFPLAPSATPADMLDVAEFYPYDPPAV